MSVCVCFDIFEYILYFSLVIVRNNELFLYIKLLAKFMTKIIKIKTNYKHLNISL